MTSIGEDRIKREEEVTTMMPIISHAFDSSETINLSIIPFYASIISK